MNTNRTISHKTRNLVSAAFLATVLGLSGLATTSIVSPAFARDDLPDITGTQQKEKIDKALGKINPQPKRPAQPAPAPKKAEPQSDADAAADREYREALRKAVEEKRAADAKKAAEAKKSAEDAQRAKDAEINEQLRKDVERYKAEREQRAAEARKVEEARKAAEARKVEEARKAAEARGDRAVGGGIMERKGTGTTPAKVTSVLVPEKSKAPATPTPKTTSTPVSKPVTTPQPIIIPAKANVVSPPTVSNAQVKTTVITPPPAVKVTTNVGALNIKFGR